MVDFADISGLVWLIGGLLFAFWAALGYYLGAKRPAPVEQDGQELERLKDESWALRDEAVARRKAEAASEAKSRFLATMAHEIRTPLNGILGLADLLNATEISAEQQSYITSIRQSGVALNALVHEILDFSRIEAGHLNLNPEIMSLTSLTESVAELLAPRAMEKGLEISTFVSNKLPEKAIIDAARVRQVLLNLAGNAVKFTKQGGVGISAERLEGNVIRFSVADTGPGIAASERGRIFREFETGDKDLTRVEAGAGLGLAISQRLVAGMGGSLNLEESEGFGARFTFTIPFELDSETPNLPQKLTNKHILVVGQSHFEAPFLARRLLEAGNEVTLVSDPAQIPEILRRGKPDALLVDSALGEVEASHVSALAQRAGVARTLILFSPYERAQFNQKIGTHFDGWLVKPIRAQSLLTQLWTQTVSEPVQQKQPETKPEIRRLRALLAEDDEVNALVSRKVLESLGAEVTLVRNGDDALAALKSTPAQQKFDLALLDIRMPGKSGLVVARDIRQFEQDSTLPRTLLIAASANSLDSDRLAALQVGFDFYLNKPLAQADLGEVLRKHFHGTEQAA